MKNLKTRKNLESLKEIKSRLLAGTLSATILLSTAGCTSNKKKSDSPEATTEKVAVTQELEKVQLNESEVKFNSLFDTFKSNVNQKFYLNDDDLKTSLIIMNIDQIIINDSKLIEKFYSNGLNSDKELKDYETFISKYREYNINIKDSNEFLLLSNYCYSETDSKIIKKLENLTKKVFALTRTKGNETEITKIINMMIEFYDGKDITLEGEEINKDDLSNGFNITSEVFGQISSMYARDFVDEKLHVDLDNKLKNKDRRSRVITLLETYGNTSENIKNTYINGYDTYVLDGDDKAFIAEFEKLCDDTKKELNKLNININDTQVKHLIITANIDYLASDSVESAVLKAIVGNSEASEILNNTTSAVELIENYNKNQTDKNNLYTYNIGINKTNDEQKINHIAVKGALTLTYRLRNDMSSITSADLLSNNSNYEAIKLYNQYSSNMSFNIDNYKVTKNDTGYGIRYITDAIYYSTLKQLPYQFDGINNLINNSDKGMSSIDSITWAIESECSEYQFVK